MVEGAVLPAGKETAENTLDVLSKFIHTRGRSIPTGSNKAAVVILVDNLIAEERVFPNQARILDPQGRSLIDFLRSKNSLPDFVSPRKANVVYPPASDPGWVPLSEMSAVAPIVSESTLRTHFAAVGAMVDPNVRVLESGFAIIQSQPIVGLS